MSSSSSNTSSPLTTRKQETAVTSGNEGRSSGEDEVTDITTTVSERSPTTAVEAGNADATIISTDSVDFPIDDPSSGSTESGPDPLDPRDFMTSSYSEISFATENNDDDDFPTETGEIPDEVAPAEVQELASSIVNWTEKKLVSYVAEDLEERLKRTSVSPASESHDETHTLSQQQQESSNISPDLQTLKHLEETVSKLSGNINQVLAHINQSTHSLSGLTVECMKSYERCLTETADVVDQNIKSMYQLMAQVEEINRSMKSIDPIKKELTRVEHLLDVFERAVP